MLAVRVALSELRATQLAHEDPEYDVILSRTALEDRLERELAAQVAALPRNSLPAPCMITILATLGLLRTLNPEQPVVEYVSTKDAECTGCLPVTYTLCNDV